MGFSNAVERAHIAAQPDVEREPSRLTARIAMHYPGPGLGGGPGPGDPAACPATASLDWTALEESESLGDKIADQDPEPATCLVTTDATAHLVAMVQALPLPLKQVFLLREMEELSTAETARLLNMQEGLVKWRLYKARQILKANIQTIQ